MRNEMDSWKATRRAAIRKASRADVRARRIGDNRTALIVATRRIEAGR